MYYLEIKEVRWTRLMVSISSSFKSERWGAASWPLTLVLDVFEKFHQLIWPGISNVTGIRIWSLLFSSMMQSHIKDQDSLGPQWSLKLLASLSGTAGAVCEQAWEQAGEDSSSFMTGILSFEGFLLLQSPSMLPWAETSPAGSWWAEGPLSSLPTPRGAGGEGRSPVSLPHNWKWRV